jgi:hypothetical protein
MPLGDPVCNDLPGMVLRLAAEAGQVSLAMTTTSAAASASVDQHAADIRQALARRGRPVTTAALLSYAQGFAEAAIARGWWPPHRRQNLRAEAAGWAPAESLDHMSTPSWAAPSDDTLPCCDALDEVLPEAPLAASDPRLDWESLRLAAICRLLIEAEFSDGPTAGG